MKIQLDGLQEKLDSKDGEKQRIKIEYKKIITELKDGRI